MTQKHESDIHQLANKVLAYYYEWCSFPWDDHFRYGLSDDMCKEIEKLIIIHDLPRDKVGFTSLNIATTRRQLAIDAKTYKKVNSILTDARRIYALPAPQRARRRAFIVLSNAPLTSEDLQNIDRNSTLKLAKELQNQIQSLLDAVKDLQQQNEILRLDNNRLRSEIITLRSEVYNRHLTTWS